MEQDHMKTFSSSEVRYTHDTSLKDSTRGSPGTKFLLTPNLFWRHHAHLQATSARWVIRRAARMA